MHRKSKPQSEDRTESQIALSIDDLQIGKLMEQFGFNPNASSTTAKALILNLVRSAYGPEAAREFMRQMNLEKNRGVEAHIVMDEFKTSQLRAQVPMQVNSQTAGREETQLSFFDGPEAQKKSRPA